MLASALYVLGASVLGACSLLLAGLWGFGIAEDATEPFNWVALAGATVLFCVAMMLAGVA